MWSHALCASVMTAPLPLVVPCDARRSLPRTFLSADVIPRASHDAGGADLGRAPFVYAIARMVAKSHDDGEPLEEGYYGNLTPEQEKALKDVWAMLLDIWSRNVERSDELARLGGPQKAHTGQELGDVSHKKSDAGKQKEAAHEHGCRFITTAVEKYGGRYLAYMFWRTVMMDPPDHFVLRFLRARNFHTSEAVDMLIGALMFRLDINLEDILLQGEYGFRNERGFLDQYRRGISYIQGSTEKNELPIYFIHVGRHYTHEQNMDALQKFIVLSMENSRLLCSPPVEKIIILFDLRGFGLKNADWQAMSFILKCMEAYYPESIRRIYIHSAPWIFKGIWSAIQPLLNEDVHAKIKFSSSAKDLTDFIPMSRIPVDMGGTMDWTWQYAEPEEGENDIHKDTQTRDAVQKEWDELQQQFLDATQQWIRGDADADARHVLVKQLRLKYYQIAPYVRARNVYQRKGIVRDDFLVHWDYPQKDSSLLTQDVNEADCATQLVSWLREQGHDTLESSVGGSHTPCASCVATNMASRDAAAADERDAPEEQQRSPGAHEQDAAEQDATDTPDEDDEGDDDSDGDDDAAVHAQDFDMDDEECTMWQDAEEFSETDVSPEFAHVKVSRRRSMQNDAELHADMERTREAIQLFLNSQVREAEELCVDGADHRLYLSAGMSLLNSVKCLMTFEPDDMQMAIKSCKHTIRIARVLRAKRRKLPKIMPGKSQPPLPATLLEQHAELVYAESLLCKSIVGIVYAGDTIGLIREAMSLRKAYQYFRALLRAMEQAEDAKDASRGHSDAPPVDEDLRSGVCFGMGGCMLVLSLLEPRLLKFMEGVGFEADRSKALEFFERAGGWSRVHHEPGLSAAQEGLRRPLCDLAILVYHLSVPTMMPVPDVDVRLADHVLSWNRKRFPHGISYLFFSSLLYACQALPDKAVHSFRLAIDAQNEYRQFHHLVFWRLALTYLGTCDYTPAYECFDLLSHEFHWSQCVYQYAKAAVLFEQSSEHHMQAETIMRTVPGLVRKMAGRHMPFEHFVVRKAEKFVSPPPFGLPAMEFAYLWHCLAQTPVYLLVEEHLERIDHVLRHLGQYESPAAFPGGAQAFYSQHCLAHFLRGVVLRYAAFPKKYTVVQTPRHEHLPVAQMASDAAHALHTVCADGQHLDAVDRYLVYFAHYELGKLYTAQGEFAKARCEFELIQSRKPLVPQDSPIPLKSGKASYLLSHMCQMRANFAMSSMPRHAAPPPHRPPHGPPKATSSRPPSEASRAAPSSATARTPVPTTHYNDIPETLTRTSADRRRDLGRRARQSRLLS